MNTKLLVSLGSTLAATKLAQTISHLEADDVLNLVGLARRRWRSLVVGARQRFRDARAHGL
jgi:hypothetical protein